MILVTNQVVYVKYIHSYIVHIYIGVCINKEVVYEYNINIQFYQNIFCNIFWNLEW